MVVILNYEEVFKWVFDIIINLILRERVGSEVV